MLQPIGRPSRGGCHPAPLIAWAALHTPLLDATCLTPSSAVLQPPLHIASSRIPCVKMRRSYARGQRHLARLRHLRTRQQHYCRSNCIAMPCNFSCPTKRGESGLHKQPCPGRHKTAVSRLKQLRSTGTAKHPANRICSRTAVQMTLVRRTLATGDSLLVTYSNGNKTERTSSSCRGGNCATRLEPVPCTGGVAVAVPRQAFASMRLAECSESRFLARRTLWERS